MQEGRIKFSKLLTLHINNTIQKLPVDESKTTSDRFHDVHKAIRKQLDAIFQKSKHKLTEESRSWLTDQFFKSIVVNGETKVGELVIMNEYSLSSLPYDDIKLLHELFDDCQFAEQLNEEFKQRMTS